MQSRFEICNKISSFCEDDFKQDSEGDDRTETAVIFWVW